MSFEIHPETPPEGVPLTNLFPEAAVKGMYKQLQKMGESYNLQFKSNSRLSNARLALEASEYAKDKGKFHEFHEGIFRTYFTDGKDIGDLEVILALAEEVGLECEELKTALTEKRYSSRLLEARAEGRKYHVTGTPTYVINDKKIIVGAQPLEVFRETLAQLEG